jgi:hypothetical protein
MNTLLDWSGATLEPWLHTTLGGRLGGKVEFTPDSGSRWTYGPWDLDTVRECRVKGCNLMDSRQTQPSNPSGNPAHLYYVVPENLRPVHSLYARMDVIVEPGWLQNSSNTNKLLEVFVANGVGPILLLYGGRELHAAIANDYWKDTLYAGCVIGQQSPHCPGGGSIGPDVFTPGVKHRVEMLVVTNTQGRDGRAALWLDGRRQIDVGNVRWSAGAGTIGQVDLNAIWGGRGGRLTRPQHIWLSGLHISVSPDYLTAAPGPQSSAAP